MILFIARYPDAASERDGMLQRIAAIDKIFAEKKRVYLQITKRFMLPRCERITDNLTIYKIPLLLSLIYFFYFASRSRWIYVHSLINAAKILPAYFICKNIITDMHGLVPEECFLEGFNIRGRVFSMAEPVVIRRSHTIVTVTNAMAHYFNVKYNVSVKALNIPIYETTGLFRRMPLTDNQRLAVIYSGGTNRWQNIDLMLETIAQSINKYHFIILSGDIEYFEDRLNKLDLLDKVELRSVPKDQIYAWYQKAVFGFILRDDIPINNVACPTKLMEYLANGIVPIVIQPNIGDFQRLGYKVISLETYLNDDQFSFGKINEMVAHNYFVMERFTADALDNIAELKKLCFKTS